MENQVVCIQKAKDAWEIDTLEFLIASKRSVLGETIADCSLKMAVM